MGLTEIHGLLRDGLELDTLFRWATVPYAKQVWEQFGMRGSFTMTYMVHHVSSGQGMTEALGTEEPMLRTSVWTYPIVAMSQCAKHPMLSVLFCCRPWLV